MNVFSDCDRPELRGCALTIGNFDGVHRGHLAILRRLRELADEEGVPAAVLTFDPHPAAVLAKRKPLSPLTWLERRTALLAETGLDAVIILSSTPEFFQTPAEDFFHGLLREKLAIRAIVEGPDFRFGRKREGDIRLLQEWCGKHGIRWDIVAPVTMEGHAISSSRIREAVLAGRIQEANQMLSRPFATLGTVVHGAGRGAALGYPTANLQRLRTAVPGTGIYAGAAKIGDHTFAAAISIGGNPTFGEDQIKFEAFICDFSGDLYGQDLEILFFRRLRDVLRFEDVPALLDRMKRDVEESRTAALAYLRGGLAGLNSQNTSSSTDELSAVDDSPVDAAIPKTPC